MKPVLRLKIPEVSPRGGLLRFCADQQGNVLLMTGLMFMVLLGLVGIGVDLGRQQLVRIKLQQASDAAALAGALADSNDQANVALRYFNLNYPSVYIGVPRPSPSISTGTSVTVNASANMQTYFMQFLGDSTVRSSGASTVSTNITAAQNYDMVLVMDNSGSMSSTDAGGGLSRISALKSAAQTITKNMIGGGDNNGNQVGAISWSDGVLGTVNLTSNYGTVNSFLQKMAATAGTNSTAGLDKAVTMSSSFRSNAVGVVILLTDGSNGANVSPYGTNYINPLSLNDCTALKQKNIQVYTIAFGSDVTGTCYSYVCSNSKSQTSCKVVPYTSKTSQASDPNYCPKPFLLACANDASHYYEAPDATALGQAFSDITTSVQKLRITQ